MFPVYVILSALLAAPALSAAQEADAQATAEAEPQPGGGAVLRGSRSQGENPRTGTAVPRTVRLPERPARSGPAVMPLAQATQQDASAQEQTPPESERRAVPRGSRPQGDNPRTGTAVPRSAPPQRSEPRDRPATNSRGRTVIVPDRDRTVIVRRPNLYNYYYYPRRYYPYGYGAFGLGYFYYDPYRWYPGYSTYGYYDGSTRWFSSFDIGELRIDVSPRHAQVYVDGYYAGVVDDYDGTFQALKLESGAHRIEITAPGYEALTFDVRISPGQKIRYQGDMRRVP